jgi:hypothetical protein
MLIAAPFFSKEVTTTGFPISHAKCSGVSPFCDKTTAPDFLDKYFRRQNIFLSTGQANEERLNTKTNETKRKKTTKGRSAGSSPHFWRSQIRSLSTGSSRLPAGPS